MAPARSARQVHREPKVHADSSESQEMRECRARTVLQDRVESEALRERLEIRVQRECQAWLGQSVRTVNEDCRARQDCLDCPECLANREHREMREKKDQQALPGRVERLVPWDCQDFPVSPANEVTSDSQ